MLHSWTQLDQRQLIKGQVYHEHVPAISVWILDKSFFHDERWLHHFRWLPGFVRGTNP
jgi:hypothetical protein